MSADLERLEAICEEELDAEQRQAASLFRQSRGTEIHGPFNVMLHSPQVMLRAADLGRYLRYDSALPPHLSEWAIMITARLWTQNYEWCHHYNHAIKAGIAAALLDQLARNERPSAMSHEQEVIYDFSVKLQQDRQVDDAKGD